MNNPNFPQKTSKFRVVPPKTAKQTQPQTSPQEPQDKQIAEAAKPNQGKKKLVIVGGICLGLGIMAFIPIPNYVTGKAKITSRDYARQRVTMPVDGIVTVKVESNQEVKKGDEIATVDSPELDKEIAQAHRSFKEAKGELTAAQNQLSLSQSRLNLAQQEEVIAASQVARERQQYGNAPKVRQLDYEKAGIEDEITGVQSEIVGIDSQITAAYEDIAGLEIEIAGSNQQLGDVESSIQAREGLVRNGALARFDEDTMELKRQKSQLRNEISQKRRQISNRRQSILQTQSQIKQRQSLIASKSQDMNSLSERSKDIDSELGDDLYSSFNGLTIKTAQKETATKDFEAAVAQVKSKSQLVEQWKDEVTRLEGQKNNLTLVAQTSGTVITQELDLTSNNSLKAGEDVLEIADLQSLQAKVAVRQEDHNLVQETQAVTFQPKDTGSSRYKAKVQEKDSVIVVENPGDSPKLGVKILIENDNKLLLPGGEGYAHIKTAKMPIYKKVSHELGKLIDLGIYFPWLTGD
ncbi:MAG: biotin/lipoyl-binding protein [Spirulinaceae cyanobacterium]